jgi:menaquinone-dependent protoporphyrinogen oxidase
MKLLVIYGTTKGQTTKIADRIGQALRERGDEVDVVDGRSIPADLDLARYGGAVIGASVIAGRFQPYIVDFVKAHRDQLRRMPSAFFSVSLTEADPKKRARAMVTVERFQKETGWEPGAIASFAGSIAYLRFRWLMRLIWRRVPLPDRRRSDGSRRLTDNGYEYTDWDAVARFASVFARAAHAAQPTAVAV